MPAFTRPKRMILQTRLHTHIIFAVNLATMWGSSGAASNACLYSSSALSASLRVFQEKDAYSQSNLQSSEFARTANSKYFSAAPFSIYISFRKSAKSFGKCVFVPRSTFLLLLQYSAVRDFKTSKASSCTNQPSGKVSSSETSSNIGRHPRLLHSTLPTAAKVPKEPSKAAREVLRPAGMGFSTQTALHVLERGIRDTEVFLERFACLWQGIEDFNPQGLNAQLLEFS